MNKLLVTEQVLEEQEIVLAREKQRVQKVLDDFEKKMEIARDRFIDEFEDDCKASIRENRKRLGQLKEQSAKCGMFAFKEKKHLAEEIAECEKMIEEEEDTLASKEIIFRSLSFKINQHTESNVFMNGGELKPLGYSNALDKYLLGFERHLKRNNTEDLVRRARVKDIAEQIAMREQHPIRIGDILDLIFEEYSEEFPRVKGAPYVALWQSIMELYYEGRFHKIIGGGVDMIVESTGVFYGMPEEPTWEEVLFPVSDSEKIATIEQIKEDQGESYDAYINHLAKETGWDEIRDRQLKVISKLAMEEAASGMKAFANAGVAYANSKKGSAALRGGVVNAIAGPVAGVLVAAKTEADNREKDVRRIRAEIERDRYAEKNKTDMGALNYALDQLALIDYRIMKIHQAKQM